MTMAWTIIWITALAGIGGTGLGGAVGALFRKDSNRVVSLLLSFAAGIMLSVVCFDLIPGALTPDGADEPVSVFWVIAGTAVGFALVYALNFAIDKCTNHEIVHIDKDHPKTADSPDELIHSNHLVAHENLPSGQRQLFIAGIVMAAAIALHNLPEGMVIGASFAKGGEYSLSRGGIVIAIVIGLHNIPEGMAVAVPLISGGMSKAKAVMVTALSGAPTVIGALIGYFIGLVGPMALSLSLSFASGAMLYVVIGELLPEAYLMLKSKAPAFGVLTGIAVGLVIVFI